MRPAVVVGCVALLAYASIKAAWGFGSTVGVVDPATWESDLEALEPWQWFVGLWGTVLIDLAAAVGLVTLAQRPSSPRGERLRRHLRRLATLGAAVVGSVGVAGMAATIASTTGLSSRGSEPLATWVFMVVYGSFTVVAAAFAVVIVEDRRRERAGRPAVGVCHD